MFRVNNIVEVFLEVRVSQIKKIISWNKEVRQSDLKGKGIILHENFRVNEGKIFAGTLISLMWIKKLEFMIDQLEFV